MHAHIGVNTVQSVCVCTQKRKKNDEREKQREKEKERKIMIVVAHIGVLIDASETSDVHAQIKQLDVVTTFLDMKFGLRLVLFFILSINASLQADESLRPGLFNSDGSLRKLRQKSATSKSSIALLIISELVQ